MAAQIMTAFQSLNHEAIHALKNLGLFTDKEWNILRKAARDHWIKDYGVKSNYHWSKKSTYKSEQEMFEEEAIAYAFADFALERKLVNSTDRTLAANIKRMFRRITCLSTCSTIFGSRRSNCLFL